MPLMQIHESIQNYTTTDPILAAIVFLFGLLLVISVYIKFNALVTFFSEYFGIDLNFDPDPFKTPLGISLFLGILWIGTKFIVLAPSTQQTTTNVLATLLVLTWTRGTIQLGTTIITKVITARYDENMVPILGNIWTLFALITSIGLVLAIWEVDITPLLASAGVLGVVAGFAARDTIANFFGSISLYADETYRKGDFIELDEQTRGIVRDISIRSTQIQTLDGDVVTIPNSKLNNTIIRNKTQPSSNYRITIPFSVSYKSDPKQVKELVTEVLEENDRLESQPQPTVHLRDFGESSIDFEILCYISHPSQRLNVEDEINTSLHQLFEDQDIEIPFPQRDVHMDERS